MRLTALFLLAIAGFLPRAHAQERLGTLEVRDMYLEPRFRYEENHAGGFEPGNSLVSFTWKRDDLISATVTAGTQELVGRPKRYIVQSEDELTLAEAFIEARTSLGTFRFGRVQLPFGTESGRPEAMQRFPRSMLFRQGWIGLRDQGLSYSVEHHGFFNDWVVHNGEGGENLDNKTWFTSRWGYSNRAIFMGFSGTTGRTSPSSTQDASHPRTSVDAGLDPDLPARLRFGNLFFMYDSSRLKFGIEGTIGETKQVESTILRAGHIDLEYFVTPGVSFLGRWDYLDPDKKAFNDRVTDGTFGLSWGGWYQTSTIYLFASRVTTEGSRDSNHQVLLVWRSTPLARGSQE